MNMCNDEETSQQIVDMFGYFSEIKMMNAYDALNTFKEDFVNVQYYVLKEGLGYLCDHMIQEAKHYGCVCQKKNSFVVDVRKNEEVSTRNETYRTKNIVFAIKGGQ